MVEVSGKKSGFMIHKMDLPELGPSLTTARGYHSCSTMRDGEKTVIIAAGGLILDSVEIYDPTENTWHSGKNKFLITK